MEVAPDGSVWLSGNLGQGLFRLGDESAFDDPTESGASIELAPDGSLWAIGRLPDARTGIFSFDAQGWTLHATTNELLNELAIGLDGTVWVTTTDESKYCADIETGRCSGTFLMRLEDDGSLTTIDDWADVYHGDTLADPRVVSSDGDAWLIGRLRSGGPEGEVLLRFDGSEWEAILLPEGFPPAWVDPSLGLGPDGALLVHARRVAAGHPDTPGLARFDDPGWTVFTEPDGGEQMFRIGGNFSGPLTVAADDSFWFPLPGGGVAHYDGATWTSYLDDTGIGAIAIAPDDRVWLYGEVGMQGHLYVITPEAVAASE